MILASPTQGAPPGHMPDDAGPVQLSGTLATRSTLI
jgi:hypothetical protein